MGKKEKIGFDAMFEAMLDIVSSPMEKGASLYIEYSPGRTDKVVVEFNEAARKMAEELVGHNPGFFTLSEKPAKEDVPQKQNTEYKRIPLMEKHERLMEKHKKMMEAAALRLEEAALRLENAFNTKR